MLLLTQKPWKLDCHEARGALAGPLGVLQVSGHEPRRLSWVVVSKVVSHGMSRWLVLLLAGVLYGMHARMMCVWCT